MLESASAATDLDLITYLRSMPDARMRRGVRFPAWYLLLVAVLTEALGNGASVMATLRTAALNLLRLAGFRSIRSGLQAGNPSPKLAETMNQPWGEARADSDIDLLVVGQNDARKLAGSRWHVVARALREGQELHDAG